MMGLLFIKAWIVEETKTGWRNAHKLQQEATAIPSLRGEEGKNLPAASERG